MHHSENEFLKFVPQKGIRFGGCSGRGRAYRFELELVLKTRLGAKSYGPSCAWQAGSGARPARGVSASRRRKNHKTTIFGNQPSVLARHQAQEAELRAADWLEIGTPPAKIAPGESLVESRDRGEKGGVPKRAKERVLRENVASTRSVTLHREKYGADPLGSQLHGSVGKLPAWVGVGAAARPLDGSFRRGWLLGLRSVVQLAWFSARCLR